MRRFLKYNSRKKIDRDWPNVTFVYILKTWLCRISRWTNAAGMQRALSRMTKAQRNLIAIVSHGRVRFYCCVSSIRRHNPKRNRRRPRSTINYGLLLFSPGQTNIFISSVNRYNSGPSLFRRRRVRRVFEPKPFTGGGKSTAPLRRIACTYGGKKKRPEIRRKSIGKNKSSDTDRGTVVPTYYSEKARCKSVHGF